jgi:hypothetical protein
MLEMHFMAWDIKYFPDTCACLRGFHISVTSKRATSGVFSFLD